MVCVKTVFRELCLVTKIKTRSDGRVQCPLSKYNTAVRESKSKCVKEAASSVVENISSINR